jgi:hypothetical protein
MDVLLVVVVVSAAVLLIVAPLRLGHGDAKPAVDTSPSAERADLEAAKEAKYREIRDAELDYRTGKLAREDWHRLDGALRADALDILRRIDSLESSTEEG